MKTIGPQLTALAVEIIDLVKGPAIDLETKLEAFKLLTQYHVGTTRVSKIAVEEDNAGSIVSLKDTIHRATKVSKRPADPDKIQRDPKRTKVWRERQLHDATNNLDEIDPNADFPN